MKYMGKIVNLKTNDRIFLNSSSLTSLEYWDLVDSNNSLSKMQHKLQ